MKFYAEMDENNIVIGVKQVKGEILNDKHIEVSSLDGTPMGKKYNAVTEQFEVVTKPDPPPEPEIDVATITEAEFKGLVLKKIGYKVKSIGEVTAP